jgi:EamA domain-containing membrane protein RarD
MIRLLGVILIAVALLAAAFGVYGLVRKDVQGGANEAGTLLLLAAPGIAAVGALLARFGRR